MDAYFITALLFGLALNVLWRSSTPLRIDLTPTKYTEETKGPVNITCSADSKDYDAASVFMVEILKDNGQPLVYIQLSGISYDDTVSDRSKFIAEGLLSKDVSKCYLTMSVLGPSKEDGGVYTCKMFYSDKTGHMKEHRESQTLAVDYLHVNAVVRQLLEHVSSLETKLKTQTSKATGLENVVAKLEDENKKQSQLISKLAGKSTVTAISGRVSALETKTKTQTDWITDLTGKASALERAVTKVEDKNRKQSQLISQLTGKVIEATAFSAGLKNDVTLSTGSLIVFDDVIMNEGDGYNQTSGIFTAPQAGLYAFHLVLFTQCYGCTALVHIKANDVVIATLDAYDKDNQDQSSVSCARDLNQGDRVKAEVFKYKDVMFVTEAKIHSLHMASMFTGYLVRGHR